MDSVTCTNAQQGGGGGGVTSMTVPIAATTDPAAAAAAGGVRGKGGYGREVFPSGGHEGSTQEDGCCSAGIGEFDPLFHCIME